MSGKDLFEGMSYVDERFVDEAENKTLPKRIVYPWIKVASMAACLCLIIFSLHNLQPYLRGETEGAGQEAADAMPEGVLEDEKDQVSQDSLTDVPDEAGSVRAPETMIRVLKLTETGFVGTVHNNGGFSAFEDGTEITVMIDLETDPNFKPEDYQIGDLVYVMYTDWDVNERTMVASILGIVDEPIRD